MLTKTLQTKTLFKSLSIAIAINFMMGTVIAINAQESNQQGNSKSTASENNGLPSYRRDGGTRGQCVVSRSEFVALVPETAVSFTASLKPKLYFYVPETNYAQTIEFVLRDRNDRLVYETVIETEGKSGIMSLEISLPQQSSPTKLLESGADYRWYLSNICNPDNRSQDIVLEGWIEQKTLSPTTKEKLEQLSPIEQANFYDQKGLWYDALAIAAIEVQTKSGNLANTKWSQLLTKIGLDELVNQPLIGELEVSNK